MASYQAQLSRDGGGLTVINVLLPWVAKMANCSRENEMVYGATFDCTGCYVVQQASQ